MPVRAAGAGASTVVVAVQLERHVGLDADNRRAAGDHVVFQASPGAGSGSRHCGALPGEIRAPLRAARGTDLMDELLPWAGPRAQAARPVGARGLAAARGPGSRALDDGA